MGVFVRRRDDGDVGPDLGVLWDRRVDGVGGEDGTVVVDVRDADLHRGGGPVDPVGDGDLHGVVVRSLVVVQLHSGGELSGAGDGELVGFRLNSESHGTLGA